MRSGSGGPRPAPALARANALWLWAALARARAVPDRFVSSGRRLTAAVLLRPLVAAGQDRPDRRPPPTNRLKAVATRPRKVFGVSVSTRSNHAEDDAARADERCAASSCA